MGKTTNRYWVVEGTHEDPNDQNTIDHSTEKEYGPYSDEKQATEMAKSLIPVSYTHLTLPTKRIV